MLNQREMDRGAIAGAMHGYYGAVARETNISLFLAGDLAATALDLSKGREPKIDPKLQPYIQAVSERVGASLPETQLLLAQMGVLACVMDSRHEARTAMENKLKTHPDAHKISPEVRFVTDIAIDEAWRAFQNKRQTAPEPRPTLDESLDGLGQLLRTVLKHIR